ncbi:Beta-secretase 1 [Thelohanellus kitauei]|uniref:Beta-secretase 1 n=1 Tax=Thelohanellus kitauei TaxID=669202 RepID=A0A0C2MGI2_THEKT|nr:Beta-secretase 1 [Thelohanellus kitauei]
MKLCTSGSLWIAFLIGARMDLVIENAPDSLVKLSLYKTRYGEQAFPRTDVPVIEENLYGKPSEGYYTEILLGNPPQEIKVLIDTGSSNFAVAGEYFNLISHYFNVNKSTSFQDLHTPVDVPYTQGHWSGILGSDIISVKYGFENEGKDFGHFKSVGTRVKVALIKNFSNFFINGTEWSGILGLGYSRLSRPDTNILPVFDQLVYDRKVKNVFSIQLCSYNSLYSTHQDKVTSGTLIFGGVHRGLYEDRIFYTPIIRKWYYEVVVTDISVAGKSLGFECKTYNHDRTIVDTGTTNFRVNGVIFESIVDQMKKNEKIGIPEDFWLGNELMCWSFGLTPFDSFPNLTISLSTAHSEYSHFSLLITPQLYLREASDDKGAGPGQKCYRFAISKSEKGIVIGAVIMEGFYVIFDREHSRIGFARTNCHEKGKLNTNSRIFENANLNFSSRLCYAPESLEDFDNIFKLIILVFSGISLISIIPALLLLIKALYMSHH